MALRDYILCGECEVKLIYDGNDDAREWLEERYGDQNCGCYTVKLLCPTCLEKLRAENAELTAQLAAAEKDVKRLNDLETLVFNGDVSIEEREPRHSEFRIHTGDTDYDKPFVGRTLREAIDAAAHRKGKS